MKENDLENDVEESLEGQDAEITAPEESSKNKMFNNFKSKYSTSDLPAKIALIGWWVLLAGIASAASLSGGFGVYALLLMIIGLLTCLICPCLGGVIVGGAAGIWGTLVMINIYIGIACLGIMGITSLIGLIASINRVNKGVIIQLISQLIIAAVGLYYLYPLIDLIL